MYYQNQKYYLVPLTKEEVEKLQNLRNKEENEKNEIGSNICWVSIGVYF